MSFLTLPPHPHRVPAAKKHLGQTNLNSTAKVVVINDRARTLRLADRSLGSRRLWHTATSALSALWMVVGFTLAIAYALGQAITWWAVIHSFTIGVITTAILVFSRHFTEALTRTAARGFAGIGTRIAVVQVATLGLLLDGAGVDWGLVSDISALLIGGVIMWHFIDILAILRRSLANSFAMTVPFYLAASAFLVLAIIFAVTANHIPAYDQLIAAHSRAAVWGFAWLSIIGTAVTLVPTIAGATISERAKKRSLTGLSIHGALLFVATLALAVGESRAAGVMIFMMAGAGVLIIHPIISEVLASAQRWSVAAWVSHPGSSYVPSSTSSTGSNCTPPSIPVPITTSPSRNPPCPRPSVLPPRAW